MWNEGDCPSHYLYVPEDHRHVWVVRRPYGESEAGRYIGWYNGTDWVTVIGRKMFDVTFWKEMSSFECDKYGN